MRADRAPRGGGRRSRVDRGDRTFPGSRVHLLGTGGRPGPGGDETARGAVGRAGGADRDGPAGTDGGGTGAGLCLHLCGAAGPEGGDLSLRRGGPPETAGGASDPGQDAGRQGRDVRKIGCPAARYSGPPARESADRDGAAGRPGAHVHPRQRCAEADAQQPSLRPGARYGRASDLLFEGGERLHRGDGHRDDLRIRFPRNPCRRRGVPLFRHVASGGRDGGFRTARLRGL